MININSAHFFSWRHNGVVSISHQKIHLKMLDRSRMSETWVENPSEDCFFSNDWYWGMYPATGAKTIKTLKTPPMMADMFVYVGACRLWSEVVGFRVVISLQVLKIWNSAFQKERVLIEDSRYILTIESSGMKSDINPHIWWENSSEANVFIAYKGYCTTLMYARIILSNKNNFNDVMISIMINVLALTKRERTTDRGVNLDVITATFQYLYVIRDQNKIEYIVMRISK